MYSNRNEVRQFLHAITPKVIACASTDRLLSSQEISNALWGLQGMNSDLPEVRALVAALVEVHLVPSTDVFTAEGLANSFGGLQTMSYEGTSGSSL
jgi:hypothetical protein